MKPAAVAIHNNVKINNPLTFRLNPVNLSYTEDELVDGLKLRSQAMFSYLYDNYAPALNGIIFKIVNNRQCSEDVLQEVFIKIWEGIHTYDSSKGRLFTWMHSLAVNKSIDFIRSRGFKNQRKTLFSNYNTSADIGVHYRHDIFDAIGINRKVAKLKPVSLKLINMAYYEGLSHSEISEQLSMPLGTVKTRMRTAINELKRITGQPAA